MLLLNSPRGVEEALLVHSFSRQMLVGLVRAGLAAAEREVVTADGKPIEVVRVRITAAGRKMIEG